MTPQAARRLWKPAVLVLLAVWLLAVGARHEPWADEAQAWLLARDSGLVELLATRVRYEGTPPLWHLVLWLCIRGGLAYEQIHLVSSACALGGAAIILWRAPFPPLLRVLLVASYFPAYQFAVVARSYALDLLLLPALASLFAARKDRPLAYAGLIGLLALSNAHSFVIAGLLGLEFAWTLLRSGALRARRGWGALALAGGLGLLAAASAWQPADNGFAITGQEKPPVAIGARYLAEALIDRPLFLSRDAPRTGDVLQGLGLSLAALAISWAALVRAGRGLLATAVLGGLLAFSVLVHSAVWHAGLFFLAWVFLLWISWPGLREADRIRPLVTAALAAVLAVQTGQAAMTGLWDLRATYSPGLAVADAIAAWRRTQPQDARVAVAGFKAFSVQPGFSANVFANYEGGAPSPAYVLWNGGHNWRTAYARREALRAFADGYGLVVVSRMNMTPADLAAVRAGALQGGYRESLHPGQLMWKNYAREDETLMVFRRADRPAD